MQSVNVPPLCILVRLDQSLVGRVDLHRLLFEYRLEAALIWSLTPSCNILCRIALKKVFRCVHFAVIQGWWTRLK